MSLQTLHLKGFHSPFLFAFFICFFSHESSVRFTVIGICSHNKEDVNSASVGLMPETSRPVLWMPYSKENLHLLKHDLICVCERIIKCFWSNTQFCVMGDSAIWCEFVLCDVLSGLAPSGLAPNVSWAHSRIYMNRRNLITNVKNAIALLTGTDRKWVHLGKILKFYQESPIPIQNPDSI